MSNSFWSHGLQHARLPCPSPSFGACSNTYPLSQWCHPIISSSVVPFSSCLQSFAASGSFPVSQFFTSGGQSVRASASVSVLPMNIGRVDFFQDRLVWSPCWPSDPWESSPAPQFKSISYSAFSLLMVKFLHSYITTGKKHSFDYSNFCWQSDISAF